MNLEPRTEQPRPRCPLCNQPMTKLEPIGSADLPPGLLCIPCNVFAVEPYTDWNLFEEDTEQ